MSVPIHKCMTKAVVAQGDQMECGPSWVMSRRVSLRLFDDRLECGDWIIPYAEIRDATLSSFRTPILRIPGFVLAVRTDTKTYHFGLSNGDFWNGELPFDVERRKASLRLSLFSLLARVAVISGTLYLLWRILG